MARQSSFLNFSYNEHYYGSDFRKVIIHNAPALNAIIHAWTFLHLKKIFKMTMLKILFVFALFLYPGNSKENNLKQMLHLIRADCGEICDTTITGIPGKYVDKIEKDIYCNSLMASPYMEYPAPEDQTHAILPHKVPQDVLEQFLYQGRFNTSKLYFDDVDGSSHTLDWTEEFVEILRKRHQ